MEGINHQQEAQSSIHTSEGCNVTVGYYGQLGSSGSNSDCGYGGGYDGCTVFGNSDSSYGDGFNAAGGGVYGLHWNGSEIKVWFFTRSGVPADITSGDPNPNLWGTPVASWAGCEFDDYFKDMSIVSAILHLIVLVLLADIRRSFSTPTFAVLGLVPNGMPALIALQRHLLATTMSLLILRRSPSRTG